MENNENNKIETPIAVLMYVNAALFLSLTASTIAYMLFEIAKKIFS